MHAARWLTDARVRTLSFEAKGIYIDLLCYLWLEGKLSTNEDELRSLVGAPLRKWNTAWPSVKSLLTVTSDGFFTQKRMAEEMIESEQYRSMQAVKGKAGAKRRWTGDSHGYSSGHAPAIAPAKPRPSHGHSNGIATNTNTTQHTKTPPTPPTGGGKRKAKKPDWNAIDTIGEVLHKMVGITDYAKDHKDRGLHAWFSRHAPTPLLMAALAATQDKHRRDGCKDPDSYFKGTVGSMCTEQGIALPNKKDGGK